MKVLIKGAYGHANFGDDALMCCLEDFFIENCSNLDIAFCANNDAPYSSKLLKKSSFINVSKNKDVSADLLVYGGGTQFFLFNENSGGLVHYLRQLKRLLAHNPAALVVKVKERISGKPAKEPVKYVAAVGIGLGPFHPGNSRVAYIGSVVRGFNFLSVRDEESVKYCLDWNCEEVVLGADICFSSYLNLTPRAVTAPVKQSRKRIGVVVRDWVHDVTGASYTTPLMDVVESYDDNSAYEFVFVVFSMIKDEKWQQLLKKQGRSFIAWNPEEQSLEDFTEVLNGFDGFITARYHGAVFAAILNKPAICVEIEPKLKILTEQIPQLLLWEKPFREEDLIQKLEVFQQQEFDCSTAVNSLRVRSDNMFKEFKKYLKAIS